MAGQQGDVLLAQTTNDGDIESVDGVVTMTCGLETAVYLSMFSGAGWWGDLQETDPDRRHPSETEQLIESLPAVPANLRRIEQAALRDLAMFLNQRIASTVQVTTSIPDVDRVELQVIIEARGQRSEFNFVENWECFRMSGAQTVPGGIVPEAGHTNIGVFTEVGDYVSAGGDTLRGLAVNSINGNVVVGDAITDRLYTLTGGVAPFTSVPAPERNPRDLSIDQVTGDVWSIHFLPSRLFRQTGGVGAFIEYGVSYPSNNMTGVAVNSTTGDVWICDVNTDEIYRLPGGEIGGTFEQVGVYPGGNPTAIAVDSSTGTVWIQDAGGRDVYFLLQGETVYTQQTTYTGGAGFIAVDSSNSDVWVAENQDNQIHLLRGGTGTFEVVSSIAGVTVAGVTVNIANGDLWILDNDATNKGVYHSPGILA